MQAKLEHVRANVPMGVLWKWTGVSAFLHGLLIAALCGVSYLGFKKRETASKEKAAAAEATAKNMEAEEAAKAAKAAGTAPVAATDPKTPDTKTETKPAATPAPATPDPAKKQADAEKTLGIDKVAKPDEMPKSPFSSKGDDLLKDLK